MKVTLLNTYNRGGAAVAATRLAQALNNHNVETAMLTTQSDSNHPFIHGYDDGLQHYRNRFNFIAERLTFLPHEASKAVRFHYSLANFGSNISQHPLIQNSDILHFHWINQGFLSFKNIQQLGALKKPIVWTLHDMWTFTGGCHYSKGCTNFQQTCGHCLFLKNQKANDLSHRLWQKKKALYPQLNLQIVTCSKWLKGEAQKSSLLKDVPIYDIPNPIDTTIFKPLDVEAIRKKHHLPTDKKLLLFGAMNLHDERKGYKYLKESFEILTQQYPDFCNDVEVIVFGKGDETEIATLPLKVHSFGQISDLQKIIEVYNAADLFIIPSLEDNLPNTIMESLACGTPVVAFNTGGIPEMVFHQKQGYIAPQRDSVALAEGIKWVLENQNRYTQLAQQARQKVLATYAPDIVAAQYLKIYQKA